MKNFYIIIFITSTLFLVADFILRYMEKIKGFDFDKKIFSIKEKEIPIGKLFPESITMLIAAFMVMGATGFLMVIFGINVFLTLPISICFSLSFCFFFQYLLRNVIKIAKGETPPKGDEAFNLDGYCTETIEEGGVGKVCVFYKENEFIVNAVGVLESVIDEGEKIISVYEEDGFYFVSKIDEIYKGVDTRF